MKLNCYEKNEYLSSGNDLFSLRPIGSAMHVYFIFLIFNFNFF